jgi:phasin family protein
MATKDNPFDFSDFSKMLGDYQLPGVDWQEVMASQQKNIAALTKANQVLLEGAQAVMQRQAEVLQRSMAELSDTSRELMSGGDPQAGAQKRFELAKTSFEQAIANMRELAELAGKSNSEALEVINHRAAEAFEEIKASIKAKT